jgi:hypothetical protein
MNVCIGPTQQPLRDHAARDVENGGRRNVDSQGTDGLLPDAFLKGGFQNAELSQIELVEAG